jgi:hypothetical protein
VFIPQQGFLFSGEEKTLSPWAPQTDSALETRRVPQVSLLRPGILLGKANRVRPKGRTSRKTCFSAACLAAEVLFSRHLGSSVSKLYACLMRLAARDRTNYRGVFGTCVAGIAAIDRMVMTSFERLPTMRTFAAANCAAADCGSNAYT